MNRLIHWFENCAAGISTGAVSRVLAETKKACDDSDCSDEEWCGDKHLSFAESVDGLRCMTACSVINCLARLSEDEFCAIKARFPASFVESVNSGLELYDKLLTCADGVSPLASFNTQSVWAALLEGCYSKQESYAPLAEALLPFSKSQSMPPFFVGELRSILGKYKVRLKSGCLWAKTTSTNMKRLLGIANRLRYFDENDLIPSETMVELERIPWKTKTNSASHYAQGCIQSRLSWSGYALHLHRSAVRRSDDELGQQLIEALRQRSFSLSKEAELGVILRARLLKVVRALLKKPRRIGRDVGLILPRLSYWVGSANPIDRPTLLKALFGDDELWQRLDKKKRTVCILQLFCQCRNDLTSTSILLKLAGDYIGLTIYSAIAAHVDLKRGASKTSGLTTKKSKVTMERFIGLRLLAGIAAKVFHPYQLYLLPLSREGLSMRSAELMAKEMLREFSPLVGKDVWLSASSAYQSCLDCSDARLWEQLNTQGMVSVSGLAWVEHAIYIGLFAFEKYHYFVFGNRGEGASKTPGLMFYRITKSEVVTDAEQFAQLIKQMRRLDRDFLDVMNNSGGGLAGCLGLEFAFHYKKTSQKIDNCTFAAVHHGVLTHLVFDALSSQEKESGLDMAKRLEKAFDDRYELYKSWRLFTRSQAVVQLAELIFKYQAYISGVMHVYAALEASTKKVTPAAYVSLASYRGLIRSPVDDASPAGAIEAKPLAPS